MAQTNAQAREEARQRAADERAQERGPGLTTTPPRRTATVHIRVTHHPEHGEAVVYVPGETLPGWLIAALDAGKASYDVEVGVFTLDLPAPKAKHEQTQTR